MGRFAGEGLCAYYTLAKQVECPTDQSSRRFGAELALEEDGRHVWKFNKNLRIPWNNSIHGLMSDGPASPIYFRKENLLSC